ncbi:hypothetical protein [Leucobacter sp. 1207-22]|uniref:hypothetical protein n=1 Tax=Leucobacter sp. 1207-22 TaxID=2604456 RepID=UPI0040637E42
MSMHKYACDCECEEFNPPKLRIDHHLPGCKERSTSTNYEYRSDFYGTCTCFTERFSEMQKERRAQFMGFWLSLRADEREWFQEEMARVAQIRSMMMGKK